MTTAASKRNRINFSLMAMALAALTVASMAVAETPKPSELPTPPEYSESWYVVTIRGQKCGYVHEILRTVESEVLSESVTQIEIKRGPASVKMRMERGYREALDGTPLGFRSVQTLGTVPQTVEGIIKNGKIHLKDTQPGAEFENAYDFDPEIRFSWGQMIAGMKHGLTPDTKYTVKSYDPSLRKDGPIEMVVHIRGKETVDVLGKPTSLNRMTSSLKIENSNMTVDSEVWVDDEHTPIVTTVDIGPIQMKMYRTTKEDALKDGAPPEMFLETIITANRDVSRDAKSVKYKISVKPAANSELPELPDTDMQKFERIDARSAYVTVQRTNWADLRNTNGHDSKIPKSIEKYLEASSVCDSGNRTIKRLALRAVRKDDSLATKSDKLRKYITKYITNKGMDVGFATATEVAEKRCGDCTEHGVLLAAVARAAGIPARGVGGLVGVPSSFRRNVDGPMDYGFHMWTQVYIHGKWIDIDAAMRQTDCDATHIAISLIPLGDEGMMSEIWNIIPMLGQIDIDIVEVKE